jgi:predicted unusual protein kinase regulating ubiquinone biosynthesis (AarF/ABC1/UbiB family)
MRMAKQRQTKLPTGRIGRFARLAKLGAQTGATFLVGKANDVAAQRAARVLGELRGLAAKVGQMASYIDGIVPEEHRPAFEAALASLRTSAPTSSPAEIRKQIFEDLGKPVEELFASWEDDPFASASIGQVHRATLADGRALAVKVQHPGIQKAVENDLRNASVIEALVRNLGASHLESKRLFAEVQERLREELDYRIEAQRQIAFQHLHEDDHAVIVPRVIEDRSSRRVLATELAEGMDYDRACRASENDRVQWATVMWRFVFRGNLVGGMFNADPHPGNFLFQPDGRVVFLDFGCVQPVAPERQILARRLHRAALAKDLNRFDATVKEILQTKGGTYEKHALLFSRKCFEPIFRSPYRITRAFTEELTHLVRVMKREIDQHRDGSLVPLPPGSLFLNRLQFGFFAILARFDAEVDYAAIERPMVEQGSMLPPPP